MGCRAALSLEAGITVKDLAGIAPQRYLFGTLSSKTRRILTRISTSLARTDAHSGSVRLRPARSSSAARAATSFSVRHWSLRSLRGSMRGWAGRFVCIQMIEGTDRRLQSAAHRPLRIQLPGGSAEGLLGGFRGDPATLKVIHRGTSDSHNALKRTDYLTKVGGRGGAYVHLGRRDFRARHE